MNLLDLAVKITCDDQASGQVSGIGSKITSMLGTAAKVGGAAVAALGTATVAVGKTALDAYANYEQLVGGMDTLFKGSSAKMQQYAANAYQTAGVSANRYMEISTSFAASLINSLGGDTEAAAEMANTAIQDMSDNANKMGTSLDVVQEAYQSLARGNYEMLDSLKLGYGGTKTELERLLSDAEQIAASQGMVRDYSVDSYSDIVEAIHLVQDEMGITGTTAAEAATTIEGSINTAKAAWDNWLAGLGNEDADMGALTDQLVQSVVIAGENIIPRFGMIMSNLVTTVTTYAPQVGQAIMSGLSQLDFTSIGQTASNLILMLVNGIVQNLPMLASAALQIVMALGQGLITNGPQILASLGQLLLQLANYIIQNVPNILNAAVQFFGMLIQGIAQNAPTIIATLVSLLGQLIAQVISWAAQMLGQAISAGAQFLSGLAGQISQVPGRVAEFLGNVISNVISWASQMGQQAIDAATQFANNVINGLAGIPSQVVSIGSDIIGGLVDGVVGAAGSLIDAVGGAINDALGWARSLLGIASPSKVFAEIGDFTMQGFTEGIVGGAQGAVDAMGDAVNGITAAAQGATLSADPAMSYATQMGAQGQNASATFSQNLINGLATTPMQMQQFFNTIIDYTLEFVNKMSQQASNAATTFSNNLVDGLSGVPSQMQTIGQNIVNGLINGINNRQSALVTALVNAVNNAVASAKDTLGISSPSRIFREIGRYTMEGMALGIGDGAGALTGSVDDVMRHMAMSARDSEVPAQQARTTSAVGSVVDEVRRLREDIKGLKIYLNGRTLVGGIADDMDKALGRRMAWSATR